MEIVDLLKKIQDTIEYDDKNIEDEKLNQMLESIRYTPSVANVQPWEVYIIKDTETKKLLNDCILDPMMRKKEGENRVSCAPIAIVMAMDRKRARARFGQLGEDFYAVQDIAAAINNMRLAAAEIGISSSWIREISLDKISEVLKLPRLIKPIALITMGYSSCKTEIPPLLEVKDWTHCIERG